MVKKLLMNGLLALVAIGASGCVAGAAEEDDDSEETGVADLPLGWVSGGVWAAGSGPVDMGDASNRTCFLTGILGDFESGNEWVHAYISDGRWYLHGNNTHGSARVLATCVSSTLGRTAEFSWSQGDPGVDLGSDKTPAGLPRACFLTRMGGDFNGMSESVSVSSSFGHYWLTGLSSSTGVHARARCITVSAMSTRATLAHQFGVPAEDDPISMAMTPANTFDTQCMLTGVAGEFSSDNQNDHSIIVWRHQQLQAQYFNVWTTRSRIQGNALCVK
ncbi:hypothetical protein sce8522 [Sorangium cellulosum So ce56]|uniref:Secreted protein n=1 Tax=Sorangium cellulosum (strain So ce56) TaxID=448385 RepID=A9FYY8_SORC5|nr:hypothetical protein sce8522 [Sorangium cellulosum So ce56]